MNFFHIVNSEREPLPSMYCLPASIADQVASRLSEKCQNVYLFEVKPNEAVLEIISVECGECGLFDIAGYLHVCVDHNEIGLHYECESTNKQLTGIAASMSTKIRKHCDVILDTKIVKKQHPNTGNYVYHVTFKSELVDLSEGDVLSLSNTLDKLAFCEAVV